MLKKDKGTEVQHKREGGEPLTSHELPKGKTEWLDKLHEEKKTASAPRSLHSSEHKKGAQHLMELNREPNQHDQGIGKNALLDGARTDRLDKRVSYATKMGILPEGALTPEQKELSELFKNPAVVRSYLINPDATAKSLGEKFPNCAAMLEKNKPFSVVNGHVEVNKESALYQAIEKEVREGVKEGKSPIRKEMDKLLSSTVIASLGGSAGIETKAYELIRASIENPKEVSKIELKIAKLIDNRQAKEDLKEVQGAKPREQYTAVATQPRREPVVSPSIPISVVYTKPPESASPAVAPATPAPVAVATPEPPPPSVSPAVPAQKSQAELDKAIDREVIRIFRELDPGLSEKLLTGLVAEARKELPPSEPIDEQKLGAAVLAILEKRKDTIFEGLPEPQYSNPDRSPENRELENLVEGMKQQNQAFRASIQAEQAELLAELQFLQGIKNEKK